MGKVIPDKQTLYKIADMYYNMGLTLNEIANRIGVAPMTVSRLLAKAREVEIVKIIVNKPIESCLEQEQKLKNIYGLTNAVVIKVSKEMDVKKQIAEAAAFYLDQILKENLVMGIGIGGTTAALVDHLPERIIPGLKIIQLLGGFQDTGYINSNDILYNICRKFGAKGTYFHAPVYTKDIATRDILYKEIFTKSELNNLLHRCNIAILGIGNSDLDSIYVKSGFIQPDEMNDIKANGGVGDILGQFFDANGKILDHPVNRRVLAVPIDELQNIEEVIIISASQAKVPAIKAALKMNLNTTLIIDYDSAMSLIDT